MPRMIKQKSPLALHGGEPAATRSWPTWPVWDDAERRGLLAVLESGNWWFGDKVKHFEREYAAFHHVRYGVTCTNGTTALAVATNEYAGTITSSPGTTPIARSAISSAVVPFVHVTPYLTW